MARYPRDITYTHTNISRYVVYSLYNVPTAKRIILLLVSNLSIALYQKYPLFHNAFV